jgi:hypothetical protein
MRALSVALPTGDSPMTGRRGTIYLRAIFALLFFLLPALGQITNHQLNSPTRLEVNLGPTPVDQYDSVNCTNVTDCATNVQHRYVAACTSTVSVRQCYQSALNTYRAQEHVAGVRFQFALCGGYYSTPLLNCGGSVSLSSTWASKLNELFQDVHAAGMGVQPDA